MKRRTSKKPLIFSEGGSDFRTTAFGFLEANELIVEYLPIVMDLLKEVSTDGEEEEVDIGPLLSKLPKKTVSAILVELFSQTECKYEGEQDFTPLDPNDFEGLADMFPIAKRVFAYNWPDFFGKGEGTELPVLSPETPTSEPTPISNVIQI